MSKTAKKETPKAVRRALLTITVMTIAVIFALTASISTLTIRKSEDALRSTVISLTSALNLQMKMNIEAYLATMETTGTLVFSSEDVYTYDASAEQADGYDSLSTEKRISDTLYDLCIMSNYVDFAIVYSNGHSVGKLSNGTKSLFGDSLYGDMRANVTRARTADGWFTGYGGDFKRIYYVKVIHENALLVTSLYTSGLDSVFDRPDDLEYITVRLMLPDRKTVIYSTDTDEAGTEIPAELYGRMGSSGSSTVMDDDYLLTVDACANGWFVVCSAPTEVVMSEKKEIRIFVTLVSVAAAFMAVIISAVTLGRLSNPMSNIVTKLADKAKRDLATGLLNKGSFEDIAGNALSRSDGKGEWSLILVDIDNFKTINDSFGHAWGDKVICGVADALSGIFRDTDYVGRIGGDEFCVLMRIPESASAKHREITAAKCGEICERFRSITAGDEGKHHASASVGAALSPIDGKSFSELFNSADDALYVSKTDGKDRWTIHDSGEPKE